MPRRLAFTLIELLVVIAIIATLAGLLIPTTSIIQSKMKDVKCSNNLRQVALGLMAWRADHDDKFPRRLLRQPSSGEALFGPKSGMMLNGLQSKLLVCPKDNSKGSDTAMGRGSGTGAPLAPLFRHLHEQDIAGVGCSYLYQCSEDVLEKNFNEPETGQSGDQVSWFFNYQGSVNIPVGRHLAAGDNATWADGKTNQLIFGNASPDYKADPISRITVAGSRYGYPFPADLFPVIMCFHHNRWTLTNNKTDAKALCVSWNGNIFWSIPRWEHSVNSSILP